jgi:hypothetical protein
MSDAPLIDTNGKPLATKFITMSCNYSVLGVACGYQATRGARLVIPPVVFETPEFKPLRRFLDMHACDRHVDRAVDPVILLTDRTKREFEDAAKKIRPTGFRPDFEHAFIEWVLTTTPEYRQWLQRLDSARALEVLKQMAAVV